MALSFLSLTQQTPGVWWPYCTQKAVNKTIISTFVKKRKPYNESRTIIERKPWILFTQIQRTEVRIRVAKHMNIIIYANQQCKREYCTFTVGWPKPDLSLTAPLDPSVWYLARCCSSGCKTKLSSTLPSEDSDDNCAVRGGFPWDMVCLRTLVLRLHGWGVPSTHSSDVEVLLPLKIKRFN